MVPRGASRKSSRTRIAHAPGGTGSVSLNGRGGGSSHHPCRPQDISCNCTYLSQDVCWSVHDVAWAVQLKLSPRCCDGNGSAARSSVRRTLYSLLPPRVAANKQHVHSRAADSIVGKHCAAIDSDSTHTARVMHVRHAAVAVPPARLGPC